MVQSDNEPIRLSYQRGSHYNSIVDPFKATIGVGLGLPSYNPGAADHALISDAVRQSEELQIEQVIVISSYTNLKSFVQYPIWLYKYSKDILKFRFHV